jgi:hypothetical protein
MTNNTTEKMVEIPFFVGYNMAENGIGKAKIFDNGVDTITLALCGDNEVYEEPFVMDKKSFNENQRYLYQLVDKIGLENIVSE